MTNITYKTFKVCSRHVHAQITRDLSRLSFLWLICILSFNYTKFIRSVKGFVEELPIVIASSTKYELHISK